MSSSARPTPSTSGSHNPTAENNTLTSSASAPENLGGSVSTSGSHSILRSPSTELARDTSGSVLLFDLSDPSNTPTSRLDIKSPGAILDPASSPVTSTTAAASASGPSSQAAPAPVATQAAATTLSSETFSPVSGLAIVTSGLSLSITGPSPTGAKGSGRPSTPTTPTTPVPVNPNAVVIKLIHKDGDKKLVDKKITTQVNPLPANIWDYSTKELPSLGIPGIIALGKEIAQRATPLAPGTTLYIYADFNTGLSGGNRLMLYALLQFLPPHLNYKICQMVGGGGQEVAKELIPLCEENKIIACSSAQARTLEGVERRALESLIDHPGKFIVVSDAISAANKAIDAIATITMRIQSLTKELAKIQKDRELATISVVAQTNIIKQGLTKEMLTEEQETLAKRQKELDEMNKNYESCLLKLCENTQELPKAKITAEKFANTALKTIQENPEIILETAHKTRDFLNPPAKVKKSSPKTADGASTSPSSTKETKSTPKTATSQSTPRHSSTGDARDRMLGLLQQEERKPKATMSAASGIPVSGTLGRALSTTGRPKPITTTVTGSSSMTAAGSTPAPSPTAGTTSILASSPTLSAPTHLMKGGLFRVPAMKAPSIAPSSATSPGPADEKATTGLTASY